MRPIPATDTCRQASAWKGRRGGIRRFREKPDSETAQALLTEGGWFWNGGIFLFRADVMLAEARRHAPEMLDAVEKAVHNASRDGNSVELEPAAFGTAPALSIDYAVMERSDRIAMVAMDGVGWSDLGDWNAIWQASNRTAEGLAADGPLYAEDARNCLIKAANKPVALVGVEDIAVIDTPDVLLVVRRDRAQDVKAILAALRAAGREDLL
ncbi:MAG: sugar phosphate nucleotidyltransferase [Pseudomonadota bacterium]